MPYLFTLGYEGSTPAVFFELLTLHNVQTLVDVRELPMSRKPGFAKRALHTTANRYDIGYVHVPTLGCPKTIRHDYRADRNWARYTERFLAYIDTQQAAVTALTERVQHERCCLLCFEADPNFCHRLFVAERVAAVSSVPLDIVHLTIQDLTQVAAPGSAVI